jgi:hypothetical protein
MWMVLDKHVDRDREWYGWMLTMFERKKIFWFGSSKKAYQNALFKGLPLEVASMVTWIIEGGQQLGGFWLSLL